MERIFETDTREEANRKADVWRKMVARLGAAAKLD
jgi:hypothetical protein